VLVCSGLIQSHYGIMNSPQEAEGKEMPRDGHGQCRRCSWNPL
jgi:hypothetical protein